MLAQKEEELDQQKIKTDRQLGELYMENVEKENQIKKIKEKEESEKAAVGKFVMNQVKSLLAVSTDDIK